MSNIIKGYSVVELIVAMTLFITVVAISSGSIVMVIKQNRIVSQDQSTVQVLDFIVEDLVRNIRVGRDYSDSLPSPYVFQFENDILQDNDLFQIKYEDSEVSLVRNGYELPFTPSNINITNFQIDLEGESGADTIQPYVRIFIEAEPADGDGDLIQYQTFVTQRKYDKN